MTLITALLLVLLGLRRVILSAVLDRVAFAFALQFQPDPAAHRPRRTRAP